VFKDLQTGNIVTADHKPAQRSIAHGTVKYAVCFLKGRCFFPPLGLEKPMNILELNLSDVIMSVRSTNSHNLVQIGCKIAPPHDGEI